MVDWHAIEKFIGYGQLSAPIVFIGMEEGLADEQHLHDDLGRRSTFQPVMDVKVAHEGIADGDSLFTDKPRRQPTWRVMADVMLHFEGRTFTDAHERAAARTAYRAKRLGRCDGDSLLAELLPYPSRNADRWQYTDRFPDREAYVAAMLPGRIELLRNALSECSRTAILCYGRSDWPRFEQLFEDATEWRAVGRLKWAEWRGARLTLSDHFATKYFNTDAELDELAAVALPKR